MDRLPDIGDNPLLGADFLTGRATAFVVLGKYFWLLLCPLALSALTTPTTKSRLPPGPFKRSSRRSRLHRDRGACPRCVPHARIRLLLASFFLVALAPVANLFLLSAPSWASGCSTFRRWPSPPASHRHPPLHSPPLRPVRGCGIALHSLRRAYLHAQPRLARRNQPLVFRRPSQPRNYRVHDRLSYYLTLQSPQDRPRSSAKPIAPSPSWIPCRRLTPANPYINAAAWYRNHGDARRALVLLQRARPSREAKSAGLSESTTSTTKTPSPSRPPPHAEFARTHSALGDHNAATAEFQRARQLRPDPGYSSELAADTVRRAIGAPLPVAPRKPPARPRPNRPRRPIRGSLPPERPHKFASLVAPSTPTVRRSTNSSAKLPAPPSRSISRRPKPAGGLRSRPLPVARRPYWSGDDVWGDAGVTAGATMPFLQRIRHGAQDAQQRMLRGTPGARRACDPDAVRISSNERWNFLRPF